VYKNMQHKIKGKKYKTMYCTIVQLTINRQDEQIKGRLEYKWADYYYARGLYLLANMTNNRRVKNNIARLFVAMQGIHID
jgi:hypothetical protein